MSRLFLSLFFLFVNGFLSLFFVTAQTITRPIGECKLVFQDDFDSTALNTNVWKYRTDTRFLSTQVPANVSVKNGYLYLNVKKEKYGTSEFTGAGIITKKGYKWGYYESRFKIPAGAGWHTSFWMMNANAGVKTYQEIDVCENDANKKTTYSTNYHNYSPTHTNTGGKGVTTTKYSAYNLVDSFHVWACDFSPQKLDLYFEGKLVRSISMTPYTHGDANIWLTSIAAPTLGGITTVDTTKLPSAAVYDYVRFYELQNPILPDTTKKDTVVVVPDSTNLQIIVDNSDAAHCTFNKAWLLSSGVTGFYGKDYAYISSTSASDYAKWTPDIPEDGNYRIYMRWTEHVNRTTAGPVEISHMEGVSKVVVNQTTNGGKWNFLGAYQLVKGNANYVKITGAGSGNVVADAVLFERVDSVAASVEKIEDKPVGLSVWPNPTSDVTYLTFKLQNQSGVSLKIYNSLGILVKEIESGRVLLPDSYTYEVNASGLKQGVYFVRLDVNRKFQSVSKLIVK